MCHLFGSYNKTHESFSIEYIHGPTIFIIVFFFQRVNILDVTTLFFQKFCLLLTGSVFLTQIVIFGQNQLRSHGPILFLHIQTCIIPLYLEWYYLVTLR